MDLAKENKLLRALLRDVTNLLNELFIVMPEDIKILDQSVELMITLSSILKHLDTMDKRDAATLSTPNHSN